MAFCGKCGSAYTEGSAFCPQCGANLGVTAENAPAGGVYAGAGPMVPVAAPGLQENVAGLLCYLLGWLTGIIFLLIDKRPFVRFHAAQSIVVFGFLFVLRVLFVFGFLGSGFYGVFSLWWIASWLLGLVTLVAWVVLMITAYQGKRLEVPVAAGIAKNIAGSRSI